MAEVARSASIALGILALAIGQPAFAGPVADSGLPSWTGPFLGIQTGMAGAKITYTLEAIPNVADEVVYKFSDKHAVYSIHAGYDQEIGDRYVWGVELSADWLGFDIDPLSSGGFGSLFSASYDITASSRLGVLAGPSTLVYGRAGLSAISTSAEAGFGDRATALLPAAVFGAGVETLLTGNLAARVEGSYTVPLQQQRLPADAERFDPRFLKVTAGLTWRLDADQHTDRASVQLGDGNTFNGAYVGAVGGYNLARMETPVSTPGATVGPFASEGPDGGVSAGYDVRLDRIVVGVGGEYLLTYAKFHDPGQNSPLQGSTTLVGSLDATAMLTGRVGMLANDSTLIYGKIGLGVARVTANPDFFTFASGGTRWRTAHQIGAGIETLLTDNASLRLEGLLTTVDEGFVVDLTQADQATLYPSAVTANAGIFWRF